MRQSNYGMKGTTDLHSCITVNRWGSGKSFLVELLKRAFDKDVSPSEITKELLQRFEYEENPKQTLLDTLQDLCWKLIREIQSNIMDFMGMFMYVVAVAVVSFDNFEFVYRAVRAK